MSYHPIQQQILTRFISQPELRYSEIKIPEVENDLFNYHLQYLVKLGILNKSESTYSLTTKGLSEILIFDSKGNISKTLRVSILLYIIDKRSDPPRILAQKRTRQPYLGDVNAGIAGKVLPGELIETAAQRKMLEETGLTGNAKLIGVIRKIRRSTDASFLDDGLFHVCVCTDYSGELIEHSEFGDNSWIDFDKALELEKDSLTTGKKGYEVLKRILQEDYSSFYIEEVITYPH